MDLNRELDGKIFEDPLDVPALWRTEYIDSEGNGREYIGHLDWDNIVSQSDGTLTYLPALQRFLLSCVASLEKRLGIESGERWSGCKDADVDGLSDGIERFSTSE